MVRTQSFCLSSTDGRGMYKWMHGCSDMVNATAHVEKQINTLIGDDIETQLNGMSSSHIRVCVYTQARLG